MRLVAPGRSARLGSRAQGCPFCPGNEHSTPAESGRRPPRPGDEVGAAAGWAARSFPNLFPLTEHHEVLVPSPRHLTSWRELTILELQDGLDLLLERRADLQQGGSYVHAFVNDGSGAGASLPHVHAQLVVLPRGTHSDQLVHGTRSSTPGGCRLCRLLAERSHPLLVEAGRHHSLLVHPAPRIGGGLLLVPNEHEVELRDEPTAEFAALLHRALQAVPAGDANLWLVADESARAHWYLEVQPRTAQLAGVELALGLSVIAQDPLATADAMRERLAMHR